MKLGELLSSVFRNFAIPLNNKRKGDNAMKRSLLFILSAFFFLVAYAQQDDTTCQPLLKDGKMWTMAYLGVVPPEYQETITYSQIKLGSTIEVDGVPFRQIVYSSLDDRQGNPDDWKESDEYMGEDNGKVYLHNGASNNTVMVMDFTLKAGDNYRQMYSDDPNNEYMDFVVTAVTDTVIATSTDRTPRRCLYLSRVGSTKTEDVWIEGIGSLTGGVWGAYVRLQPGSIPSLWECKENGQTLYKAYHAFLKEGKTWNYQLSYKNVWTGEQWTKDIAYVVKGTTDIDAKTYSKVYRITEEGSEYNCALREENQKVWMYRNDEEFLLYDFGMLVGDSYTPSLSFPYEFQLSSVKPMRFRDEILNVMQYDVQLYSESYASVPVIEGVGCEAGWNILELFAEQPTNGIIIEEHFQSCFEDGRCVFTNEDFSSIITGVQHLRTEGSITPAPTYYNLSGQRLFAPRHGINIVNGRKVVVK